MKLVSHFLAKLTDKESDEIGDLHNNVFAHGTVTN